MNDEIITWVAVDYSGNEWMYNSKPIRITRNTEGHWQLPNNFGLYCPLPKGSIEKLTGKKITWYDNPIKLM